MTELERIQVAERLAQRAAHYEMGVDLDACASRLAQALESIDQCACWLEGLGVEVERPVFDLHVVVRGVWNVDGHATAPLGLNWTAPGRSFSASALEALRRKTLEVVLVSAQWERRWRTALLADARAKADGYLAQLQAGERVSGRLFRTVAQHLGGVPALLGPLSATVSRCQTTDTYGPRDPGKVSFKVALTDVLSGRQVDP